MKIDGRCHCGTPLYATSVTHPQSYSLRLGTITQREALVPLRQIWKRSKLGWVDAMAAVPALDKG